jgi:ParB/RepB/Spo0J family partition protein
MIPQLHNIKLNLTDIHVDKSINSRQAYDEQSLNKLAEDIKENGALHPPVVMRLPQKEYPNSKKPYLLVAGFRRFAAYELLGQKDADFRVAPETSTLKDGLSINLSENLGRDDLKPWEIAFQCAKLRNDFKMTNVDIAKSVKAYNTSDRQEDRAAMSETHINNLIRCTELHKSIIKEWKDGNKYASLRVLIKLAAEKDPKTQLDAWRRITGELDQEAPSGDGAGEEEASATPAARPTRADCQFAAQAIADSDHTPEWKQGAMIALAWAAGERKTLPGVKLGKKGKRVRAEEEAENDPASV